MKLPSDIQHYPVVIVQDRYNGVYSGGQWLAISNANLPEEPADSRATFCLEYGPHADDVTAHHFWLRKPSWVEVGNTPQEALDKLYATETVAS